MLSGDKARRNALRPAGRPSVAGRKGGSAWNPAPSRFKITKPRAPGDSSLERAQGRLFMRKGMRPIFATVVAALFLCGTATAVTAASDQKKKVTHVSKSDSKSASRRPA